MKVNYFRAKDKATGRLMSILVNEANYMFVLQPWCIADYNDDYRRHAARRAHVRLYGIEGIRTPS